MSLLLATSGDIASRVVAPEGVDFDGVNDYLSRSTDLVGNVDGKAFTFSAWVYIQDISISQSILYLGSSGSVHISRISSTQLRILAYNTSSTVVLNVTFDFTEKQFLHILCSIDLSNTANRKIYVNDYVPTNVTWTTYVNDFIDFTQTSMAIGGSTGGLLKLKGRLSHVFLDYTYRDLSIEANRRLFITADGKPTPTATLKALNPILYLPLKDNATAHINEGTGGNFTLNGTIATSNRGANQDNCVASYFDGTADYLSRTSLTGIADGKIATLSFTVKPNLTNAEYILSFYQSVTTITRIFGISIGADGSMSLVGLNSGRTNILTCFLPSNTFIKNKTYTVSLSLDMSNQSNTKIFINGTQHSLVFNTFVDDIIDFSFSINTPIYGIGRYASSFSNTNIGELYFDTKYIDLATNNPFWDKDTNKPVPVRKVIANTGVTPLIAMPLDASNAGKNYGTGGDFTANSAPYVGARGASEFWARSAKFDGTTGYLSRGALAGAVDSKTFSLSCYITADTLSRIEYIVKAEAIAKTPLSINKNSDGTLSIVLRNSSDTVILNAKTTAVLTAGTTVCVQICIDLQNSSNRFVYINGTQNSVTWTTYTNDTTLFSTIDKTSIAANTSGATLLLGRMSACYFTTDYIDFSQEVNRLKFVDAFNMPLDLAKQIDAGVIPKPLIYLPFDDPSNLGKNLGTGGSFSVVGSVTQGSDVNG